MGFDLHENSKRFYENPALLVLQHKNQGSSRMDDDLKVTLQSPKRNLHNRTSTTFLPISLHTFQQKFI